MPSGRRRPDRSDTLFLDRGLGRHVVAAALRDAGAVVLTMADVYPFGEDQHVSDPVWLRRAAAEGWIALTKDTAIVRAHADVLAETTLRVFALNNANLTGTAMAERFVHNLHRIRQRARHDGPYVYVVEPEGLALRWRRPTVDEL